MECLLDWSGTCLSLLLGSLPFGVRVGHDFLWAVPWSFMKLSPFRNCCVSKAVLWWNKKKVKIPRITIRQLILKPPPKPCLFKSLRFSAHSPRSPYPLTTVTTAVLLKWHLLTGSKTILMDLSVQCQVGRKPSYLSSLNRGSVSPGWAGLLSWLAAHKRRLLVLPWMLLAQAEALPEYFGQRSPQGHTAQGGGSLCFVSVLLVFAKIKPGTGIFSMNEIWAVSHSPRKT